MPQTRPNGTTTPINSDAYNLTTDLAAMADSGNVNTVCTSQAQRDALTLFPGYTVVRQDLPGAPIQVWDGAKWNGSYAVTVAALTPNSLYTPRGLGFINPSVYRLDGRIYLQGVYKNVGTLTVVPGNSYQVATLPNGFAPSLASRYPFIWDYGNGGPSGPFISGFFQINSNGSINYNLLGTSSNTPAGYAVMSLDGVSWLDD